MKSKKIMAIILAATMMSAMSINSFAAENVQESNTPNQILQDVSATESEEVLKHIQANFVSKNGLLKDVEPIITVQKVVSPLSRSSADNSELYAITVEQPVMFSTGITDTEYAPTMDASIRGTIYYNQSGLFEDYYESFRLEYRSGSGIHFSNKTYEAGFTSNLIYGSINSYTTNFTKNIAQWGKQSMELTAWADVSGNGSTDSITLAISQFA